MPHDFDEPNTLPITSEVGLALEALLFDEATISQMELIRDRVKIRLVINDDDGIIIKSFILERDQPHLDEVLNVFKAYAENHNIMFNSNQHGDEFYMGACSAREFFLKPDRFIDLARDFRDLLKGVATPEQLALLSKALKIESVPTADGNLKLKLRFNSSHGFRIQAAVSSAINEVAGQENSPIVNVQSLTSLNLIAVEIANGRNEQLADFLVAGRDSLAVA